MNDGRRDQGIYYRTDKMMAKKKNEQVKLYAVLALALGAAAVAYFQFVYKRSHHASHPGPSVSPIAQLLVPRVEAKIPQEAKDQGLTGEVPSGRVPRDIFKPFKTKARPAPQGEEPMKLGTPPLERIPAFTLQGTILGGGRPMAFINGKLVQTGDRIRGYEVISIGKNEVVLDSGRRKTRLEMVKND